MACMLCVMALCFGLALAGCSSGSSSSAGSASASADSSASSAASASESAAPSDAATEVVVPPDIADATDAAKEAVENNDTTGADDFDSLPVSSDDEAASLGSSEIDEGLEDASKAPDDVTLLSTAGVQLQVPIDWAVSADVDGYVFQNPERTIAGYLFGYPKKTGAKLSVEALVKSLPNSYAQQGFTGIEIINNEVAYSSKGRLASANVTFTVTSDGVQYIVFAQVVESANYVNYIELVGSASDFYANIDELQGIVDSIGFNVGEAI